MNYTRILGRAWKILWSYRALWIFGIILALTSGGGSSGGSGRTNFNNLGSQSGGQPFNLPAPFRQGMDNFGQYFRNFQWQSWTGWIAIGIALLCLLILLGIVFKILHYVSQVALVKMVDDYEVSAEKKSWKQGLKWGWSRSALRLFLIDLLFFLPIFVIAIILIGLAAIPVLLGISAGKGATAVGIIATLGLIFVVIFLLVIVGVLLSFFMELIRRVCVLEGKGVFDSIRGGWQLIRKRFLDVFLMWLILVGIGIGYFIVAAIVSLVLLMIAIVIGGGIGAGLYFAINAAAGSGAALATALSVGGLLFIVILGLPLLFLGGLKETYVSSAWTLAYRELVLPPVKAPAAPVAEEVDPGGSSSAVIQ